MRKRNPYVNLTWNNLNHVQAISHTHFYPRTEPNYHSTNENTYQDDGLRQDFFDSIYNQGIRAFGISNYNPSIADLYPLENHVLDIKDAISFPNAENRGFGEHFNQLGSLLDNKHYLESESRWAHASELYDRIYDTFDAIIANMKYSDAGGITINHPKRSNTTYQKLIDYLNYSEWVLGVEVYNYRSERNYNGQGWAIDFWDAALSQGVQCYGFFAQDTHNKWDEWSGGVESRNVLLVPELTEHETLKAFKEGRFYGAIHGGMVKFTNIKRIENTIYAETDTGTDIRFIGKGGQVLKESKGSTARYDLVGDEVYVRVEVDDKDNRLQEGEYWSQDYETLYSQAIMIDGFYEDVDEDGIDVQKTLLLLS